MNQIVQRTPRARARRLIVILVLLVLAGAGAASAYWTATTWLNATTSAATVGLQQQLLPADSDSPLATTYTAEHPSAAGLVALTNTGSRAAEYTLDVETASASAEKLPAALQLTVGAVADGQECAAGSALHDARTGEAPLTISGAVAAGESVELCLQTALSADDIALFADEQISLTISSTLKYAEGEDWSVGAEAEMIAQTVGPRAPSVPEQPTEPTEPTEPEEPDTPSHPGGGKYTGDGARYNLTSDQACIQRTNLKPLQGIALQKACGPWESQWRLTDAGDGRFHIDFATNEAPGEHSKTRWTATGSGQSVALSDPAADGDAQKWIVTQAAEGQLRFESVAHPGHYLTVGDGLWNPTATDVRRLTLEPSGELAAQSFGLERVGNPFREMEEMKVGSKGPSFVELSFSKSTGYEAEMSYRVFLAHEDTPDARVAHPTGALSGWFTTVQLKPDAELRDYVASADGDYGNSWVHIEQKLPGGDWTPVAVGKIHIAPTTPQDENAMGVYSGWRE